MIAQTTIENIKSLGIYDVVSKYNDIDLKKAGKDYKACSPWTGEKTPSFYVIPQKNIFKCFSSGKGGDAITFVMEKESVSYVDAVKSLCEQHGIKLEYDKNAPKEDPDTKHEVRMALEWAKAHFCSHEVPETFIKGRNYPEEIISSFQIGYALPAWDDLLNSARRAGIATETLMHAGLIRKRENSDGHYDYFRDRIMFPIFDYRGNVVAFTGRDAETTADIREVMDKKPVEKPPKYMNSTEATYNKSAHLYGLYHAVKGGSLKDGAYLVEGPTDVLRCHHYNITATVAPCGAAFTEQQAALLKRYTDKITIIPDNDEDKPENPGMKALERNAMVAIKAGFTVKVLKPGV